MLKSLVLEGRIFTTDALLTQRSVAQTIVEAGGDYVMLAKLLRVNSDDNVTGDNVTGDNATGGACVRGC